MPAWPIGVARVILDEVDSTNRYAATLAKSRSDPLWVLAHKQTAAKGRRGRNWFFDEGNFAASYLTWPNKPVHEIAQMSFVAALALFDTVCELGVKDLGLKWPNDVLIDRKKLSGILLETIDHETKLGLIIGIGVNLQNTPSLGRLEENALPAISLSNVTDIAIDPTSFLDRLAPTMVRWQKMWIDEGFSPIREAWLARAIGLGTPITARLPNGEYKGVFEDIDPNGSLVLRTEAGRMVLPAADVYFEQNPQA